MTAMSSMIRLLVWKSPVNLYTNKVSKGDVWLLSVVLLNDGFGCSLNGLGSYSSLETTSIFKIYDRLPFVIYLIIRLINSINI